MTRSAGRSHELRSEAILKFLQPAMNPFSGCSSGKTSFKTNRREGLSCNSIFQYFTGVPFFSNGSFSFCWGGCCLREPSCCCVDLEQSVSRVYGSTAELPPPSCGKKPMKYQLKTLQLQILHHHQLDHHHQQRDVAPKKKKKRKI